MQFKINGVLFVHPRYLYYRKYFFDLKLAIEMSICNYKMGAWWQNLRLVHNSTLFS